MENLITENNELLATKNALNIVKDDLIAKVDELQSELTMSKDETQQLTAVKNKLRSRVSSLEDEFKKTKEELDECKQKLAQLKEVRSESSGVMRLTRLFLHERMTRRAFRWCNARDSLALKWHEF